MCGHQPGKEPLAEVDRAVLIAIQLEPTGPTAIRVLVERCLQSKRNGPMPKLVPLGVAWLSGIDTEITLDQVPKS